MWPTATRLAAGQPPALPASGWWVLFPLNVDGQAPAWHAGDLCQTRLPASQRISIDALVAFLSPATSKYDSPCRPSISAWHKPGPYVAPLQVQAVASYQDRFIYVLAATFERSRSTMEVWRLDLTSRLWEVVDTHGVQQCGHAVVQTWSWMPEEVAGRCMMSAAPGQAAVGAM